MLNTVLFDMGGTLEDIWNTQETQAKAMDALQKTLRAHGLELGALSGGGVCRPPV